MLPYQSLIPAQAQPYLPTSSPTLHASPPPKFIPYAKRRGAEERGCRGEKIGRILLLLAPQLLCTPAPLPSGKVASGDKVTKGASV